MRILVNTNRLILNGRTRFGATDGVEPYTFSVSGGNSGTIDAASGIYTAPPRSGVFTITATDANGDSDSIDIVVMSHLKLFCDIIQQEMGLENDQVYIYNQKFDIPPDERLYVAIGVNQIKPFGSRNFHDGSGAGLESQQYGSFQANLSINIMSRNTDALERKEEVLLALNSTYSEQQQNNNSFYVAPLTSSFANLSQVEGAAIPFRFNISVNIQYAIKKTRSVNFYSEFNNREINTNL